MYDIYLRATVKSKKKKIMVTNIIDITDRD